jgi:signal transduction histidine kinase
MPGTIRARCGGREAHPRRHGFAVAAGATLLAVAPSAVRAQGGLDPYIRTFATLEWHEVAALALSLGIIVFAVVTAILLLRTHTAAAKAAAAARSEILSLRDTADRAHALLLAEPQIVVIWPPHDGEPEIIGDVTIATRTPVARRALAFGTWLEPGKAHALEDAVDALRARGESFSLALTTLSGRHVEADGRAIGGRAVMRIRDLSGAKREYAELAAQHQKLLRDIDSMHALIAALPSPIWTRDATGQLTWVNPAYAKGVEARDAADAVERGLELLDRAAREDLGRVRALGQSYTARLPVVVAGTRRMLDVIDLPSRDGSAGIGIDVTESDAMRAELARMTDAHRRTLDQLATAVAIFDVNRRLTFYNAAYRLLWGLEAEFLDSGPSDAAVLDRLRAARKLPEEMDFRGWKNQLHEAYRAIDAREHEWHLPDRRTLRVVTTPNPEGGVTYLFDDVSERLELERRHNALIRVQGETLENLAEAVAVFGSDGRLDLHNSALVRSWKLDPQILENRPHIEAVIAACLPLHGDDAIWSQLRAAITGLESREPVSGRLERTDGSVVSCATVPLPDGATLVTFHDITDSVNVERALRERADALLAADQLKSTFVQHVSYELRSPLTNIIGFAQLLDDPTTGPLSDKQHEYLNYINASSSALLAIINDILDLATIDAGAMQLDLGPVDIARTMNAAAEGVRDRLTEQGILLDVRAPANIGSFTADERRVRQVLYNLLSNAVSFSPNGEVIIFTAERRDDAVVFSVSDRGPGIPTDIADRVFDRFESHTLGSDHRGAGLGLSIVRSFVELHGGTVALDSAVGRGTTVTCAFPLNTTARRAAAE